jgi:hypothetical protein
VLEPFLLYAVAWGTQRPNHAKKLILVGVLVSLTGLVAALLFDIRLPTTR